MTAYDAGFADLYDVFYGDKPYGAEAAFIDGLFGSRGLHAPGRLLDVACGTGRHAVEFAKLGWNVVGVDRSAAMLAVAKQRAEGRSVTFQQQDMTELHVSGPAFDAAVCLFDSIGYAITNAGVLDTLRGIRRNLRDGGLLVVEFWHAAAMLTAYDPRRERTWSRGADTIKRVSETSLDIPRSVARVAYHVVQTDQAGRVTSESDEVHENRFFLVQELGLFLETSGFDVVGWFAGYDAADRIDETTWHVLALAQAREGAPR